MTRFGSLIFCATLGTGLLACSGDSSSPQDTPDSAPPKNPLDLVPLDNDVSGWTVDKEHARDPNERAMTATTYTGVVGLIDGGAEDFFVEPNIPKLFLWQNYLNSTLVAPDPAKVKLYIFQMPSADQAKGIYTAILQKSSHAGNTATGGWESTSVGTESRLQDTNTQWWINFHQDAFYVEVLLDPSFGPPPDFTPDNAESKQEAVRFAQAVASKI